MASSAQRAPERHGRAEPETHVFGERQYTVRDFAGHVWTFTQTVSDSDPASWGGVLVGR